MKPSGRLRVLLRALAAMRALAPQSRRRDWYRQWRADVWHEWRWAARTPGPQPQAATALAVRVAGAARHALWLRWYVRRLEMISHDLRYGWRLMLRRPAFTAIAIAMLGLGIGTSVTIFSWLQTALQPIPGVPDRDRLVILYGTTPTRDNLSTSIRTSRTTANAGPPASRASPARPLCRSTSRSATPRGGSTGSS